ncbi:hypothetical protein PPSIR1_31133 [Plesiocystis pacifica SIR-1]|uniref:Lipoprotein n=1 Tax=Plesiocystis pacifica SIR-1 TaxID=391625 RepID=A6GH22_9BACT|nr:hypothetical protein [Plesiocystis pacifica]EDM74854.1 hypothetical protein PPSIR1_31133 [Plesiocystis pacifica SIR-1]
MRTAAVALVLLACACKAAPGADAGSEDEAGDTGEDGQYTVSATLGSEGGELELSELPGWIAAVRLTLPAGALEPGQSATLTLGWDEGEATLDGATPMGSIWLEVEPRELTPTVEQALEAGVALDTEAMGEAAEGLDDPGAWLEEHVVLTRDDEAAAAELTLCETAKTPGLGLGLYPLDDRGEAVNYFQADSKRSWLFARYTDFLPHPLGPYAFHITEDDGTRHDWHFVPGSHTWGTAHPHTGPLRFTAYPVSVAGDGEPRHTWPAGTAGDTVEACITEVATKILDLYQGRFRTLVVDAYGDHTPLPWHIVIYDFTTSSSTLAAANYPERWMQLPTTWLDPQLWAGGCFTEQTRPYVHAMAHEMFHWQQQVYVMDANDPIQWGWGKLAWHKRTPQSFAGPHPITPDLKRKPMLWFQEATAQHVAFEISGETAWVRHGLPAYPLDGVPWMEWGDLAIAPDGFWGYRKGHYIKYLTDREGSAAGDDLAELHSLLDAIGDHAVSEMNAGVNASTVDLLEPLPTWAASKGRDPFGFFREVALLRGCVSGGSCPEVPPAAAKPFGSAATGGYARLIPRAEAEVWWAPYILDPDDPHDAYETPFGGGPLPAWEKGEVADLGASWVNADTCRFDSTTALYSDLGAAGQGLLESPEPTELPLPETLAWHATGTRIDFVDDLSYEVEKYLWRARPGADCPPQLHLEWYHRTDEAGSLTFGDALANGDAQMFTTEPPDAASWREVTLLVGNNSPLIDSDASCSVLVEVLPGTCPCVAMPMVNGGGGADDLIVACELEGGEQFDYCNDEGFWSSGLLTPKELPVCWQEFPVLGEFCGLSSSALD